MLNTTGVRSEAVKPLQWPRTTRQIGVEIITSSTLNKFSQPLKKKAKRINHN